MRGDPYLQSLGTKEEGVRAPIPIKAKQTFETVH